MKMRAPMLVASTGLCIACNAMVLSNNGEIGMDVDYPIRNATRQAWSKLGCSPEQVGKVWNHTGNRYHVPAVGERDMCDLMGRFGLVDWLIVKSTSRGESIGLGLHDGATNYVVSIGPQDGRWVITDVATSYSRFRNEPRGAALSLEHK